MNTTNHTVFEQALQGDTEALVKLATEFAVPIGIAFGFLLLTCLWRTTKKRKISGTTVLIVGETGVGKTSLLYRLGTGKNQDTTSSIATNDAKISLPSPKSVPQLYRLNRLILFKKGEIEINCIDIPGHRHFRPQMIQRLPDARGLLLVIDSSNKESIIHSSDFIYRLLINPQYRKQAPPTLIVLNKQDLANARKTNVVKEDIITEIERLKISKKAIEDEDSDIDWLRLQSGRFNFEDQDIEFAEVSTRNGDVDGVVSFLQRLYF